MGPHPVTQCHKPIIWGWSILGFTSQGTWGDTGSTARHPNFPHRYHPDLTQNMGEMMWKTNGTGWFSQDFSRISGILSNFLPSKKPNQLNTTDSKCIISSFSWTSVFFFVVPSPNKQIHGERLHPAWHRYLFHQHGGNAAGTLELETGVGLGFRWSFGAEKLPAWDHDFFLSKRYSEDFLTIFPWFLYVSLMLFCSAVSVSPKTCRSEHVRNAEGLRRKHPNGAIMEPAHLLDPIFFELHTLALRKATSWAGYGPKTDGVK